MKIPAIALLTNNLRGGNPCQTEKEKNLYENAI